MLIKHLNYLFPIPLFFLRRLIGANNEPEMRLDRLGRFRRD